MNGDGAAFAIVDAIALLEWAFLAGPEPPCLDAADAHDGGTIFALTDALYLLLWGFAHGPAPPLPGPDRCGIDPTDDEVGCTLAPEGCP